MSERLSSAVGGDSSRWIFLTRGFRGVKAVSAVGDMADSPGSEARICCPSILDSGGISTWMSSLISAWQASTKPSSISCGERNADRSRRALTRPDRSRTRHSPQTPSPPQRLVIKRPACCAASNTVEPDATEIDFSSGKKTTRHLLIGMLSPQKRPMRPCGALPESPAVWVGPAFPLGSIRHPYSTPSGTWKPKSAALALTAAPTDRSTFK